MVGKTIIKLDKKSSENIDGMKLFELSNSFEFPVKLDYVRGRITITINYGKTYKHWLLISSEFLERFLDM